MRGIRLAINALAVFGALAILGLVYFVLIPSSCIAGDQQFSAHPSPNGESLVLTLDRSCDGDSGRLQIWMVQGEMAPRDHVFSLEGDDLAPMVEWASSSEVTVRIRGRVKDPNFRPASPVVLERGGTTVILLLQDRS